MNTSSSTDYHNARINNHILCLKTEVHKKTTGWNILAGCGWLNLRPVKSIVKWHLWHILADLFQHLLIAISSSRDLVPRYHLAWGNCVKYRRFRWKTMCMWIQAWTCTYSLMIHWRETELFSVCFIIVCNISLNQHPAFVFLNIQCKARMLQRWV